MSTVAAVCFEPTPQMGRALELLATTGLFGADAAEVAERLLAEKLRELIEQGWLTYPRPCPSAIPVAEKRGGKKDRRSRISREGGAPARRSATKQDRRKP